MADDEGLEEVKKILRSHGIAMSIGGCGCCGSPWITFRYQGKTILDEKEYASFDTNDTDRS